MATRSNFPFLCLTIAVAACLVITTSSAELSPTFYQETCPRALSTIKRVVESAVRSELRMGASLLRLHFHDCFVNGCDASVLLDDTDTMEGEKNARPNANSLRGFEVVDWIKREVDEACGGPVVSCADILAVAARDSVVALGGPTWKVQLGRRDSTKASKDKANSDLPSPAWDLPKLLHAFEKVGLDERDLVALSGGHTVGLASCNTFRDRIYNDTNINPGFAERLQQSCPRSGGDGSRREPFDGTPVYFDNRYFKDLFGKKGLLHSDQALYGGVSTNGLVERYSRNPEAFEEDFGRSMVRMGNNKLLTDHRGQIRINCRRVN